VIAIRIQSGWTDAGNSGGIMDLVIARRSPDGSWSEQLPNWDSASTLVQVYGPASLLDDPAPIDEIARLYPNSIVSGCSGAGVVENDEITDGDLIISVARFQKVRLTAAYAVVSGQEDHTLIGKNLRDRLLAEDPEVSGIFLVTGSETTEGDSLCEGFEPAVGEKFIGVGGGLAGSMPGADGTFETTWALDENRRPVNGAIAAIGFSGDALIFRNSARGGWKPLGPQRIATSADAFTLNTLDNRPALELYKEYLGDEADGLPAVASRFPISSRPLYGDDDEWAPAGVFSVDDNTDSLHLTRKIVEGSPVQMLRAYSGELFDAAEDAANDLNPIGDGTHLAIVTSCLGRRVTLGARTADELVHVRQALPVEVGMVGFYGMGEFSTTASTPCKLYNYTMTLALIGEHC